MFCKKIFECTFVNCVCTVCGLTDHKFTNGVCTVCGLGGHTCVYDRTVIDSKYLIVKGTCQSKALFQKSCSCGKTFLLGDEKYPINTYAFEGDYGKHEMSNGVCTVCGHSELVPSEPFVDRGVFNGATVIVSIYHNGSVHEYEFSNSNEDIEILYENDNMLDIGAIISHCLSVYNIDSGYFTIDVVIFFKGSIPTTYTTFYMTESHNVDVYAVGYDFILNEYKLSVDEKECSLVYGDDCPKAIKGLAFSFDFDDCSSSRCDFLLCAVKDYNVGDLTFLNMFTGVYDGMVNVFYGMTNFDIFGYNISMLIIGLFTLAIAIIVVKKVI